MLALIFITSFLLVCELPLLPLKFKQWSFKGNEVKYCFAGFAIAVLAVSVAAKGARGFLEGWWPIILVYVLLSWMIGHHPSRNPLAPLRPWLPYVAFIIAAFSALRLAKFNLDERQTTSFIGVPTPANALFWGRW